MHFHWSTIRIFLFALLASSMAIQAQEVTVQASLSKEQTTVNTPVILRVRVNTVRSVSSPEFPLVDGLTFGGEVSMSREINSINAQVEAFTSFSCTIVPSKAGIFQIPPITVRVNNQEYKTNPLTLSVSDSPASTSEPSGTEESHFGELIIPKQSMYVGEALPMEFRAYIADNIPAQLAGGPSLESNGFTVQPFAEPQQTQSSKNGMNYNVVIFQTAVTPVKAGPLTLGPAQLPVLIEVRSRRRSFEDDFFGMFNQTKRIQIRGKAQELEVKPLPVTGQPEGFEGAVGKFELTAKAKSNTVNIGDPLTVELTITGKGNFDRVTAPKLMDSKGWKLYESSNKFTKDDNLGLSGKKVFEIALVPSEKHSALPPLQFSYFDPDQEKYFTVASEEIPVSIEGTAATPTRMPQQVTSPKVEPTKNEDIHYIRLEQDSWKKGTDPVYRQTMFWAIQTIPFLGLLSFLGFQFYVSRSQNEKNRAAVNRQRERGRLLNILKSTNTPAPEFLDAAIRYLQLLAAPSTHKNPAALDNDEIIRILNPGSEQIVIQKIFQLREEALYSGNTSEAALNRGEIIQTLEKFRHA